MTEQPKQIVLEAGKPPRLVGPWTVGEVRQAAEFLARWIDSQTVSSGPEEAATSKDG